MTAIQEGAQIPDLTLLNMSSDGPRPVSLKDLCAGKKVVLFALPGAFTPTCSARHLPGYVDKAREFAAKGVDEIVCISVNDPFVMGAWGRDAGVGEDVLMLSDGNAEFADATGLHMDGSAFSMGKRLLRFAMVIEDGVIKKIAVEEQPGSLEVSGAEAVLPLV